jgi:hypothetical protein
MQGEVFLWSQSARIKLKKKPGFVPAFLFKAVLRL